MPVDIRGVLTVLTHQDRSLSKLSWWAYSTTAAMFSATGERQQDDKFRRYACKQGQLPRGTCEPLRETLEAAAVLPLEHDDCVIGYSRGCGSIA